MQRRTFTKLLSSMLVVPLLNYQPETIDRHKLLGMFLDDDTFYRYDLTRPYVVNRHSYATDGRIMARITTNESEWLDEVMRIPPFEHVFNSHFKPISDKWHKFKLAELDELVPSNCKYGGPCPVCNDRRVSFGPSYPSSEADVELLLEYDPDDNTVRDASCQWCHGKSYFGKCYQQIGSEVIRYDYAKKLAQIPGCEVNESSLIGTQHNNSFSPILFRSEIGISGCICSVRVTNK